MSCTYTYDNGSSRVRFSLLDTEADYDYVYVKDAAGATLATLHRRPDPHLRVQTPASDLHRLGQPGPATRVARSTRSSHVTGTTRRAPLPSGGASRCSGESR